MTRPPLAPSSDTLRAEALQDVVVAHEVITGAHAIATLTTLGPSPTSEPGVLLREAC